MIDCVDETKKLTMLKNGVVCVRKTKVYHVNEAKTMGLNMPTLNQFLLCALVHVKCVRSTACERVNVPRACVHLIP